ncbi:hypothetical protein [Pyrobaculum sp.]|uniref:hypothetical protein n=1 Tax=Pyrobaculum sp. TaxID=2004705 RepID=UPI003D119A10
MIGVLYEIGRSVYKWAVSFVIIWSFLSSIAVLMAGSYIANYVPTTPFTTLAIISRADDVATALRSAVMSAISVALGIGMLVGFGYLSSYYYISISFRTAASLLDMALVSSMVQSALTAATAAIQHLGPAAAVVIGGLGVLLSAAVAVYVSFYAAGVPPPQ